MNHWGPYVLPKKGYAISNDRVHLQGQIVSKYPQPESEQDLPFVYDIGIDAQELVLKTPFFDQPFDSIQGKVVLTSSEEAPNIRIIFDSFKGRLNGIDISGRGYLDFESRQMDLDVRSDAFELSHFRTLFPQLQALSFSGTSNLDVDIKGAFRSPLISGQLGISDAYFYGLEPTEADVDFTLASGVLQFDVLSGSMMSGDVFGTGLLGISGQSPTFDMQFSVRDFDAGYYFPKHPNAISGRAGMEVELYGDWSQFWVDAIVTGDAIVAYRQPVRELGVHMVVEDKSHVSIESIQVFPMDGSVITGQGTVEKLRYLDVDFGVTQMRYFDFNPNVGPSPLGLMSFDVGVQYDFGELKGGNFTAINSNV